MLADDANLGLTDADTEGQPSAADTHVVEQGETVEVEPIRRFGGDLPSGTQGPHDA
jgi:hypothetical protein